MFRISTLISFPIFKILFFQRARIRKRSAGLGNSGGFVKFKLSAVKSRQVFNTNTLFLVIPFFLTIIFASTSSSYLQHPNQQHLQRDFRQSHDLSLFQKPWPIVSADEPNSAKISAFLSSHFWQNKPINSFALKGIGQWENLSLVTELIIVNELYGHDLLGNNYTRSGVNGRITNSFIRYENDLVTLQLGRSPVRWGQSFYHSILPCNTFANVLQGIQSDYAPTYDHFDMRFSISQFHLELLIGQLGSEKSDGLRIKRNIAGHRLMWISKDNKLMIELGELIIYTGHNRGIEWHYLNPSIPFILTGMEGEEENTEAGLNNDNSIIFTTFRYVIKQHVSVFGEFIIDDFQVDDNNLQNGLGYKIGIDGSTTIKDYPITYEVEWTRINSWTYIHHGQFTNWQNRGHSLGYPYGPDLNSFHIQSNVQISQSLFFNIEANRLEKGSNTLSTEWGNSDNLDDPFPNPPVTHHTLFSTSLCWYWQYGIIEAGWSNYDFPNKIAFSDPHTKTKGGFFLKAQFLYDFGFKL